MPVFAGLRQPVSGSRLAELPVVKALEQYKRRKDSHITAAVDALIRLIQEDRDSWISELVRARDTVSHYRALSNYVFQPHPMPGGIGVRKPRLLNDRETLDALQMIYSNNVAFHQDFMSVAIAVRLKHLVLVQQDPAAMEKEWQHPAGRYVRWGWAIRTEAPPMTTTRPEPAGQSSGEGAT